MSVETGKKKNNNNNNNNKTLPWPSMLHYNSKPIRSSTHLYRFS